MRNDPFYEEGAASLTIKAEVEHGYDSKKPLQNQSATSHRESADDYKREICRTGKWRVIDIFTALNKSEFPQNVADRFDHHLTDVGRLNLLGVGLQICPTDAAITLCHAALSDWCAGRPQAPFWSISEDAKDWAALACVLERKHYAAAILNSFTASEKTDFLGYAERLAA